MRNKIIFWLVIIIGIVLIFGVMYKMSNNNPVLFSTFGAKYTPVEDKTDILDEEDLVVIGNNYITNVSLLDDFITNTNIYSENRQSDYIKIFSTTVEGDYIITEIKYDELDGNFYVTVDNTRDKFASDKKVVTTLYNGNIYNIVKINDNNICTVKLQPKELIEFVEIPKDVYICSYGANIEVRENRVNTFIGKIIEETTTYMVVEPNEDEEEGKVADRIRVNFGVDHLDYLYGVGRKVLITYLGYIKETYPAQIDSNNIEPDGYLDFEILVKESSDVKRRKILSNKDLYKYNVDYDLYYYGLDEVNVRVDNKTLPLKQALEEGKLKIEGIIRKANMDNVKNEMYKDGGSIMYFYDNYTILKKHSLDGNRDVYIGTLDIKI